MEIRIGSAERAHSGVELALHEGGTRTLMEANALRAAVLAFRESP